MVVSSCYNDSVAAREKNLRDMADHLLCIFVVTERQVHDGSSLQVWLQATVAGTSPEDSDLLMSCQTIDWAANCRHPSTTIYINQNI